MYLRTFFYVSTFVLLPIIIAVLNIWFLRRLVREQKEIAVIIMEVQLNLRASNSQSNRKFKEVMLAIRNVETAMYENHENMVMELARMMHIFNGGKPNSVVEISC